MRRERRRRLARDEPAPGLADPLHPARRVGELVGVEGERLAVVPVGEQPDQRVAAGLVEHVAEQGDVADRLGHLLLAHLEHPVVHPDLRELVAAARRASAPPRSRGGGRSRSLPPPWISNGAPSTVSAIAEHSMCQPGRPRPHGESHAVSSIGFVAFQSAKSSGSSLRRGALEALALVHVVDVAVRERAVLGQRAHAEVDVALGLVGVAALDQRLDQRDDLRHHLRRLRLEVRAPEPEPLRCPRGRPPVISAASSSDGAPGRARRVVDLVVDVGDVGGQHRVVALVAQEALEQREDDERPRVADVDAAVDGRPAGVDADAVAGTRDELLELAALGVVQPDRVRIAHGSLFRLPGGPLVPRPCDAAYPSAPVEWCGQPTGLDSGEPRWRR